MVQDVFNGTVFRQPLEQCANRLFGFHELLETPSYFKDTMAPTAERPERPLAA